MTDMNLLCSPEDLRAQELDVLIIGSGPAGVAVAERLHKKRANLKVGMIERGPVLTLTHINNIFPNERRRKFIDRFKIKPWDGAFRDGGMLISALGGRGIAAGAHLRRFDKVDFDLWDNGVWPDAIIKELPVYYKDAEITRRVSASQIRGMAQTWALGTLHQFRAYPPMVGVDLWTGGGFEVGRGFDSPVSRLWRLLIEDCLDSNRRRLFVATNTYAIKINHDGGRAAGVECVSTLTNSDRSPITISAQTIVLAASTVESARLFLLSDLPSTSGAAGQYLAEHIERRAKIRVPVPERDAHSQDVSVIIPPEGGYRRDRFQIHLRGQLHTDGELEIDVGGFAAMDPSEENRVTLSTDNKDEYGIPRAHVDMVLSGDDQERTDRMCHRIREIAGQLGGRFVTERFPFEDMIPKFTDNSKMIQKMDLGRSYHEAGTLRMGDDANTSVTNSCGQVHQAANVYVADASLFPSVGIANPMLTITALAYRVADHICSGGGSE